MEIVELNFKRWNEALQTQDPKAVVSLYFSDASFLPTLSDKFKTTKEEALEYFEHFLKKNPSGTIIQHTFKFFNDTNYAHSGLYNFEIQEDGEKTIVPARFTFVWGKNKNGIWKIVSHHSSLLPKN